MFQHQIYMDGSVDLTVETGWLPIRAGVDR